MTVLRLEYLAEQVDKIEVDVAKQEPKKGYEGFKKTLDNIILELNEYLSKKVCIYFFIASTILDSAYNIKYYIQVHE